MNQPTQQTTEPTPQAVPQAAPQATSQAEPVPPIQGAPAPQVSEPPIPHVDIPHMGTSQASVPSPALNATPADVQPAPQAAPAPAPAPSAAPLQLPPLPEGVTQEAVDAAIAHVEQTGHADGIPPQILAAACQQIEVRAAHQGIDVHQTSQQAPQQTQQAAAPANYVEAAVMDKKGTFDRFHEQRESLQSAVDEQRAAAQRTYSDALDKSGNPNGSAAAEQATTEAMKALAVELQSLDPRTIALINAMGVLSNTPEVMKGILWMEIIRAMRNLISQETKQQLEACMNGDVAA